LQVGDGEAVVGSAEGLLLAGSVDGESPDEPVAVAVGVDWCRWVGEAVSVAVAVGLGEALPLLLAEADAEVAEAGSALAAVPLPVVRAVDAAVGLLPAPDSWIASDVESPVWKLTTGNSETLQPAASTIPIPTVVPRTSRFRRRALTRRVRRDLPPLRPVVAAAPPPPRAAARRRSARPPVTGSAGGSPVADPSSSAAAGTAGAACGARSSAAVPQPGHDRAPLMWRRHTEQ
jgi:hypothetical protein